MLCALLISETLSAPVSLSNAVHANLVRKKQRKLMKRFEKLHKTMTLTKSNQLTSKHTDKKNEYLKQFRTEENNKESNNNIPELKE